MRSRHRSFSAGHKFVGKMVEFDFMDFSANP